MRVNTRLLKKILLHALLALLAFIFQTVIAHRIELFGVKPTIILTCTILAGLYEGPVTAAVFGGILGFMCDVTGGRFVGGMAFMIMCVGLVVGYLSTLYLRRNLMAVYLVYCAAFATVDLFSLALYLLIFGEIVHAPLLLRIMGIEFLYSALFVPPLFLLARWLNKKLTVET